MEKPIFCILYRMKYVKNGIWVGIMLCLSTCRHQRLVLNRTRTDSVVNNLETGAYCQQTAAFIGWIKRTQNVVYLSDKVALDSNRTGWARCLMDTLFTDQERIYIRKQMVHPRFRQWTADLAGPVYLIEDSLIRRLFVGRDGWLAYRKRFKTGYYSFGYPVFLRNYTYCLFYADYKEDHLSGYGSLALYRLAGPHWVLVKVFEDWVA